MDPEKAYLEETTRDKKTIYDVYKQKDGVYLCIPQGDNPGEYVVPDIDVNFELGTYVHNGTGGRYTAHGISWDGESWRVFYEAEVQPEDLELGKFLRVTQGEDSFFKEGKFSKVE